MSLDWIADPSAWVALATLTALEIILGIDNVIFISILAAKLPAHQQDRARTLGLALALIMRLALLFSISWIASLTTPLFAVGSQKVSGRDLILLGGGLFLITKATLEIHHKLEGDHGSASTAAGSTFAGVIVQIILLDAVFSLDSVITAVGMANQITVMVAAVVISVAVMLATAGPIGRFVQRHPTIKVLALAFLLLIGTVLVAEGFHQHIPKGYIYFALGFSVFVEMINLRIRTAHQPPVVLHERVAPPSSSA